MIGTPGVAIGGDDVTFTVRATNLHLYPLTNFTLITELPEAIRIISAQSAGLTVRVNRQQLTVNIPILAPSESIVLTIDTRIMVTTPLLIGQTCAGAENLGAVCTQTNVLGVTSLPQTGETPWWRIAVGIGAIMLIFTVIAVLIMMVFPARNTSPDSYRYLRR